MEQPQSGNGGAEAVLNLEPSSSISIAYHSLFGPHDDLILLELDEKLVPDILQQRITLRGQPDEDAVLCTGSKTYDCKRKDDDQQGVASVIKVAPGNMELVEVAPRLDKLKLLLSENPYTFLEDLEMEDLEGVEKGNTGLYKWDDLVEKVQASDEELRSELQALSAVEIGGYWRIVDVKYMDTILRMLLHNSVINDWSLDALNEDEVVNMLESDGYPHKLAHHCLHVYGNKVDENLGRQVWKLDERRVCVHFAREILKEGKRKMESFMKEWMQKIPEGMQASFNMLEGEVLTERLGVETWIRAFSVSSLPSSPAERFSILFRERPKWEWKDLQPYIRDLSVPGLSSEGVLLQKRGGQTLDNQKLQSLSVHKLGRNFI
ncbi:hypothetical protein CMV_003316 [Castanea mollissima]|uniref:Sister chromatid cohesion protein DCC1 n=1 Tax=Castanea mollissima TaxID=60419 RepID=A0A8J4RSB1_9ROSI|nr:hypothetical protein CMV_003316 [Castanea mollissima]